MTDHDPGGYPSDDDPSQIPDIPQIDELVDEEGYSWLAIGIESFRSALLDKFADCVAQVTRRYPELDMSDIDQYTTYVSELMEAGEPVPGLKPGDWLQLRGLDHYVQDGEPCPIPQGNVLSGQYVDIALCPHYKYDYGKQSIKEQLPLGVMIVVTGLCYVTKDDESEEVDGVTDNEQILLSIHGAEVRMSRLDPFDEEFSEPVPIENAWASYTDVDTSGGYSLN